MVAYQDGRLASSICSDECFHATTLFSIDEYICS